MSRPGNVLITGGLGFQGMHMALAWALAGRGVTILNTPSERARRNAERLHQHKVKGIKIVYGSVTDPEIVEKVLPGHDAVVHLAAWASVDVSLDRPRPPLMVNCVGTAVLLDGIKQWLPNARVLIASSCEVYGSAKVREDRITAQGEWEGEYVIPQAEDCEMRPRSPYAAAKAAGDRLAYGYAVTYSMNLSILRPSNIYGPGQRVGYGGAVIPTLTKLAMVGEPVTLTGGGLQTREWLHVDDLVAAYTLLLDRTATEQGEAYNVGSGEIRSIKEIGTMLCQMFPSSGSKLISVVGRPADVRGFLLDSTKITNEVNWSPQVKFDDGLARYVDWVKTVGPTAWL